MITLTLSNDELWHMLQEKGYTITITNDPKTQYVTFNGTFAVKPYERRTSYSKEFSEREIIKDSLPSLLKWTGLKPTIILDY